MRNLMLTAPTDAEAALERTRGVIASSTYLAGVERNRHPATEMQDFEDGEIHEGDGEGGVDSQFFEALSRLEYPVTLPPAKLQSMLALDDGEEEQEMSEEMKQRVNQAEWRSSQSEDEDEQVMRKPPALRASRNWEEEKRCAATYGAGYKMLNKMGWRVEAKLKVLEQADQAGREGIGYSRAAARLNVLTADFDQLLDQVHNDRVGHVGALRTYRRLRKLEGFPWGCSTREMQDRISDWVNGCMTCQNVAHVSNLPPSSDVSPWCLNFIASNLIS